MKERIQRMQVDRYVTFLLTLEATLYTILSL
jgi:hypothetical protein